MQNNPSDRFAEMRERGAKRFDALLALNGGTLTEAQAAELQQVPVGEIARQVETDAILVVMQDVGPAFPRFQFDEARRRVFPDVVALLRSAPGTPHESYVRFLLSRWDPPQDCETPMDKIRQGTLDAARLVELYNRRFEPGG